MKFCENYDCFAYGSQDRSLVLRRCRDQWQRHNDDWAPRSVASSTVVAAKYGIASEDELA